MAISLRLSTRRQITIATATRLPRCARNDKTGKTERPCLTRTHFVKPNQPTVIAEGTHPHLSLRGAQRRGNLVEVEHTPANHHCYGAEIATHRIKYGVQ